jgi:hypothetical protein
MAELKRDIRYIDRNFNDFRNTLINYSQTYFPDTYNDFTPDSTGMLFIEMASYVGDVLSFYLDNQVQETFIQYARETENLFNMAYMLGYEPKVTTAASVNIDFYQQLPAKLSGSVTVPDFDYALQVPENTTISSVNNEEFIIEDVIDFSSSSSLDPSTITVYQLSGTTPTTYLIKKTRKAISATINTSTFNFTSPVRFDTRSINDSNIIGSLDVFDSNGNQWYEVPNLAQENVYDTIRNTNTNDPNVPDDGSGNDVPYLLQLKSVQRRFAARFVNNNSLQLQFGAGSFGDNDEEIIPNPDFEPSLSSSVAVGTANQIVKLTVTKANFLTAAPRADLEGIRSFEVSGSDISESFPAYTTVDDTNVTFVKENLNPALANTIFNSLATNNPVAADGGQDGDTTEELIENALGNYQTQLRTVTKEDYLIRALSMPSNLGVVAMAYAEPVKVSEYETGTLPSILDLYVLSYDINKKLKTASSILKQNLKTYLSEYRMINDAINIKDAFIINIGIVFD